MNYNIYYFIYKIHIRIYLSACALFLGGAAETSQSVICSSRRSPKGWCLEAFILRYVTYSSHAGLRCTVECWSAESRTILK